MRIRATGARDHGGRGTVLYNRTFLTGAARIPHSRYVISTAQTFSQNRLQLRSNYRFRLEMMGPPWKIHWVFFDAVGTVFRVRGSVGEIYGREASRHGFRNAGDQAGTVRIDRAFKRAFRKVQTASPLAERSGETAQKEWWREVVRETFRDLGPFPRFDSFFESVFDLFATDAAWELEPGCRRVLGRLKLQGRNLGIISNFDSRIDSVLKALGIRRFFDLVSVSSESLMPNLRKRCSGW